MNFIRILVILPLIFISWTPVQGSAGRSASWLWKKRKLDEYAAPVILLSLANPKTEKRKPFVILANPPSRPSPCTEDSPTSPRSPIALPLLRTASPPPIPPISRSPPPPGQQSPSPPLVRQPPPPQRRPPSPPPALSTRPPPPPRSSSPAQSSPLTVVPRPSSPQILFTLAPLPRSAAPTPRSPSPRPLSPIRRSPSSPPCPPPRSPPLSPRSPPPARRSPSPLPPRPPPPSPPPPRPPSPAPLSPPHPPPPTRRPPSPQPPRHKPPMPPPLKPPPPLLASAMNLPSPPLSNRGEVDSGTLPGSLCSDAQGMLEQLNAYRALHSAPPLTWSPSLAAEAQAYATDQANVASDAFATTEQCSGDHSTSGGESIYSAANAPPPDGSCKRAISSFYSEVKAYNFASPNLWDASAWHFVQLVWRGSTTVGCGVGVSGIVVRNFGPGGCKVVVCRFSPGFYVSFDAFVANVLPPMDASK